MYHHAYTQEKISTCYPYGESYVQRLCLSDKIRRKMLFLLRCFNLMMDGCNRYYKCVISDEKYLEKYIFGLELSRGQN